MKAWLSTMPVSGECTAAIAESSGSMARSSLPPTSASPSTSLARPCWWMPSIFARSRSFVATMSLPHFLCGTPWLSQ